MLLIIVLVSNSEWVKIRNFEISGDYLIVILLYPYINARDCTCKRPLEVIFCVNSPTFSHWIFAVPVGIKCHIFHLNNVGASTYWDRRGKMDLLYTGASSYPTYPKYTMYIYILIYIKLKLLFYYFFNLHNSASWKEDL